MEYVISMLVMMGIYVILSSSFNLIIGYGGLMSIAHPIFFAFGAYTAGVLTMHTGVHPVLAVAAGCVVAMAASIIISLPSLRISGDYLVITSLGFQLGFLEVIKNIDALGGASGLSNVPDVLPIGGRTAIFALISCGSAAALVLLIRWLVKGPYGRVITAMRDDELAFGGVGRNAMNVKLSIFAIGSGMAGIAGGIYVYYVQYLDPEQFAILESTMLLTMIVVGGMGSVWGPVVGAVMLLALPQGITFLKLPPNVMAPLQGLIFSLLVIVFLFLRPQGLIGSAARRAH